jgi:uncharacterized protein YdaU (DUF1376 family)
MAEAPLWPFSTGDYLADTTHLDLEEHGAYLKLLMIIWRTKDAELPFDEKRLARMLGCSAHKFEKLWPVLAEFFDAKAGVISQKRIKKDRAMVAGKIRANKLNGSKGGIAKALKNIEPTIATATKPPADSLGGSPPISLDRNAWRKATIPEPEPYKSSSSSDEGKKDAAKRMEIGTKVCTIAGMDMGRFTGDFSIVSAWLNAGCDPDLDIYPAVEAVTSRPGFDRQIRALSYFTNPITEARSNRVRKIPDDLNRPDPKPDCTKFDDDDWRACMEVMRDQPHLTWPDHWGPPRGADGCLVPQAVIDDFERDSKQEAP